MPYATHHAPCAMRHAPCAVCHARRVGGVWHDCGPCLPQGIHVDDSGLLTPMSYERSQKAWAARFGHETSKKTVGERNEHMLMMAFTTLKCCSVFMATLAVVLLLLSLHAILHTKSEPSERLMPEAESCGIACVYARANAMVKGNQVNKQATGNAIVYDNRNHNSQWFTVMIARAKRRRRRRR